MMYDSLIVNDDMRLTINFELWGAEVDLLSVVMFGDKNKVTEEQIQSFIQGVFEELILRNVGDDMKREKAVIAFKQLGKTEQQVDSYLRGWDSVKFED